MVTSYLNVCHVCEVCVFLATKLFQNLSGVFAEGKRGYGVDKVI